MRELLYALEGKAANLRTFAMDEAGHGGACHHYGIVDGKENVTLAMLRFQNGPISADSINGIQHEDLLAIVIDRLECFQAGPFACEENGEALDHVRYALARLQLRTKRRIERGVEGTHQV